MTVWKALAVTIAVLAGSSVAPGHAGADDRPWDPNRAHLEAGALISQTPIPTEGRVRYVAANGDNAASGSASRPWKTVRHAIAKAKTGSTIVVYGKHRNHGDGIYAEQDWGTIETADITIQAYPGERPVFKGSRTLSSKAWKQGSAGWYQDVTVRSADRWPENPYPIDDQTTAERPQADDPAQLFVGPDLGRAAPLDEMDRDQWDATEDATGRRAVPPGRFHYEPPSGSRSKGRVWVGTDPRRQTAEWSTRQTAVRIDPDGHGSRIIGISFTNYSPYHGNTLGTVRVLANDVQLIDVAVTHSAATGIAASGENGTLNGPLRNLTLRRVTSSGNGALGAAIGDTDGEGADLDVHNHITVEYSRFDDNNRQGFDVADCGGGAHCAIAGLKVVRINGLVVRYSSIAGNDSTGVWCDLFCDRVSIVGNDVTGNSMSGVYYEVSRRATIASNVVAGNSTAGDDRGPGAGRAAGIKVTGSTGVVIEHNTLYDNGRQQLFLAADDRTGEPRVRLSANLFAEGLTGNQLVTGTLAGDDVSLRWTVGSGGNGYLVTASHRPTSGETQVTAPMAGAFRSAGTGDLRVGDPTVASWTGPALTDAARRTLHEPRAATTVGAVFESR